MTVQSPSLVNSVENQNQSQNQMQISHMMSALNISEPLPSLPSSALALAATSSGHSGHQQHVESYRIRFDFWENNAKIIVAIDIPGVDMEMVDIVVSRYAITIARKIGLFEEKYFASKYSPTQIRRYDKTKFAQVLTENISLPCAVQPTKKQAFNHAGTLFLTIEKLPEPTIGMVKKADFANIPNIF